MPQIVLDATSLEHLELVYGLLEVTDDTALGTLHERIIRLHVIVLVHLLEVAEAVHEWEAALRVHAERYLLPEHLLFMHLLEQQWLARNARLRAAPIQSVHLLFR